MKQFFFFLYWHSKIVCFLLCMSTYIKPITLNKILIHILIKKKCIFLWVFDWSGSRMIDQYNKKYRLGHSNIFVGSRYIFILLLKTTTTRYYCHIQYINRFSSKNVNIFEDTRTYFFRNCNQQSSVRCPLPNHFAELGFS